MSEQQELKIRNILYRNILVIMENTVYWKNQTPQLQKQTIDRLVNEIYDQIAEILAL